jgi:hypothetical protein
MEPKMGWVALVAIVVLIIAGIYRVQDSEERTIAAMAPEERAQYRQARVDYWRNREATQREEKALTEHGPSNPWMKGTVRTRDVQKKKGISGAKVTAAVITSGVSVLATGLSRKEKLTQAHCENWGSDWLF